MAVTPGEPGLSATIKAILALRGAGTTYFSNVPASKSYVAEGTKASPSPVSNGTIDYTAALQGDPALQAAIDAINAAGGNEQAQLQAARRRALIQYGQIPDNLAGLLGAGDVNSDIDQTTRDLADAATRGGVSTVAQLQHADDLQSRATIDQLTARGMIHSGAFGAHSGEDLLGYQQQQYQANQALQDALTGAYQTYLGQQNQDQQNAASAVGDAQNRLISMINAGLYGAGPVSSPAGTANYPSVTAGAAPKIAGTPATRVITGSTSSLEPKGTGSGFVKIAAPKIPKIGSGASSAVISGPRVF